MAESNVDLVGNLTRSPELRFTPGGLAVANFGIAVNRRVQNKQTNEWEDKTSFFDVACFGTLAENLCESVDKGARVLVIGRLEQRSWETNEGDKRSKVEVIADEVGPSLRWATADVTRAEKGGGGKVRAGGGGGSGDPDEEPFAVTDPWDTRWVS